MPADHVSVPPSTRTWYPSVGQPPTGVGAVHDAVIDELVTPLNTRFVAGPVGVPGADVVCDPVSSGADDPTALTAVTATAYVEPPVSPVRSIAGLVTRVGAPASTVTS